MNFGRVVEEALLELLLPVFMAERWLRHRRLRLVRWLGRFRIVQDLRSWLRRCELCGARHAWPDPIRDLPEYRALCPLCTSKVFIRLVAVSGSRKMRVR